VIPVTDDTIPNAIHSNEAVVTFVVESAMARAPLFYKVYEVIFTTPQGNLGERCTMYDQLDVTVRHIEGVDGKL
jgi:hypothetical protein